jgi:hypothetical protein
LKVSTTKAFGNRLDVLLVVCYGGRVKESQLPEVGIVYRLERSRDRSIPFYDGRHDSMGTPNGTKLLPNGSLVLFMGEERNPHWPTHEWYWWRVYCLNTGEIGFIMDNQEDLKSLV